MKKKGFTLAEAIITAVVLGVIASVVIPMISDFQPNKDGTMYNKALFTIQGAITNVIAESYKIPFTGSAYKQEDVLANYTKSNICTAIADNISTAGYINCTKKSSYEDPNFKTTDGIRFWGLEGDNNFGRRINDVDECTNNAGTGICEEIYTDYNLTTSDYKKREKDSGEANKKGLKILIRKDGKVLTSNSSKYDYENKLIEKAMSMNNKK